MKKFRVLDVFEDVDSGKMVITVWNNMISERSTIVLGEKLDVDVGAELEFNNLGDTSVEVRLIPSAGILSKLNVVKRNITDNFSVAEKSGKNYAVYDKKGIWEQGKYIAGARSYN